MLNKLKYGGVIAGIIMILRVFLPDIEIPEGLQDAIMLIIVFVSQFFVREDEVTVNRLKLKKRARLSKSALFVPLLFLTLGTPSTSAQELVLKDALAIGGGSLFSDEDTTFNTNTLFGAVQWRGLKLPLNVSTGIGIEFSVKPDLEGERELVYTVWALNRADIVGNFYAGTDMKILEEGASNFDLRIVAGTLLGTIKGSELVLEIYSLEENRPISFAILYRF